MKLECEYVAMEVVIDGEGSLIGSTSRTFAKPCPEYNVDVNLSRLLFVSMTHL